MAIIFLTSAAQDVLDNTEECKKLDMNDIFPKNILWQVRQYLSDLISLVN